MSTPDDKSREALAKKDSDGVIQRLCDALKNKSVVHEPWTSGVLTLPESETTLFYERQDGTPSSLKLNSVTEAQAQDLSHACSPATFGLNNQDVLDESYRKAGKLDVGKFAWLFSPASRSDFTVQLISGLFPSDSLRKGIRFELYKLNVYGEGSFFKAHQDTPRSEDMFGSLVCLLPSTHEGGNLLLRHRNYEFTFDGQALLQEAPPASIAWVAFFGDVEHEVALVTSGHRITITFNLYFDSNFRPASRATSEHLFKSALEKLIDDPLLSSVHAYLGFGLEYAYPSGGGVWKPHTTSLKGVDATLIRILDELEVEWKFYHLYRIAEDEDGFPFRILTQNIINGESLEDSIEDATGELLHSGSFVVGNPALARIEDPTKLYEWYKFTGEVGTSGRNWEYIDVEWVTKPNEECLDRSAVLTYGNEPSLEFVYHNLCVLAKIALPLEYDYYGDHYSD